MRAWARQPPRRAVRARALWHGCARALPDGTSATRAADRGASIMKIYRASSSSIATRSGGKCSRKVFQTRRAERSTAADNQADAALFDEGKAEATDIWLRGK